MRLASRLETAVATASGAEKQLVALRYLLARVYLDEQNAVSHARKQGMSWQQIGDCLHLAEATVRQRYQKRGIE